MKVQHYSLSNRARFHIASVHTIIAQWYSITTGCLFKVVTSLSPCRKIHGHFMDLPALI
jgi:hypothetical protein